MSTIPTTTVTDPKVLAAAEDLLCSNGPGYVRFGWERLTDEQFMATMRLVLNVDPIRVAAAWAQAQERLANRPELRQELMRETATKIRSVNREALTYLYLPPLEIRRAIVEALDPLPSNTIRDEKWWDQQVPAFELLIGVLYDLETERERDEFLQKVIRTFQEVHPVLRYRSVRRCLRSRAALGLKPEADIDQWLLQAAEGWVKQSGYEIGTIQMGRHRGMDQPYVQLGQRKFVRDRRSHAYLPFEGDVVLFRPQGQALNSRVTAVFFVPADR